ncbi:MAG: SPFH domain-containing protein [Planctomycetota bacterium]
MQATSDDEPRLAAAGLVVTALAAVAATVAAAAYGSTLAAAAAAQTLAGCGVWLALGTLALKRRRAAEEALERRRLEDLAREGRKALFTGGGVLDDAERSLDRYTRYGQLGVAAALGAVELGAAAAIWALFPRELESSLGLAALLAGAAFGLLLVARFGFALERGGAGLGGAGGRRASAGALWCFLAALALALHHKLGVTEVDTIGLGLAGVEALLGLEAWALILFEAYRPRRAGETPRPPYDSRLLGLLSAPSEIARSVARAVDYQFGFGLSQTWAYQFFQRWVLPLVAFTALSLWALSCLVMVEAHEEALVWRLGKLRAESLGPGLHVKLPWPLERAEAVPARRLQVLVVGAHGGEHEGEHAEEAEEAEHDDGHGHHAPEPEPEPEDEAPGGDVVRTWRDAHTEDARDLVLMAHAGGGSPGAAPVNLLSVTARIYYLLSDPVANARAARDAGAALQLLADREISFLFASVDADGLLRARAAAAEELERRLQAACDAHGLGIEVHSVLLAELHPPLEVADAFSARTQAAQARRAAVESARGYAERVRTELGAEVARIELEAESAAASRVRAARAYAARFQAQRALFHAAPRVVRMFRLLDDLVLGARDARKIVLGREDLDVLTDLDLEPRAADLNLSDLAGGDDAPAEEERR